MRYYMQDTPIKTIPDRGDIMFEDIDRSKSYPIPGYDGYSVTPDGKVFSTRSRFPRPEHQLKGFRNRKGYLTVKIHDAAGHPKTITIHKIQELVFLGGPKPGLQIDHIDGNKENNDITNLHQVTSKENAANPVTLQRLVHQLNTPERIEKYKSTIEKLKKTDDYKQNMKRGAQQRVNDPKWIANHAKAMHDMYQTPEAMARVYRNLDKMNNDPEMRAYNAQRSREVNSRKCKAIKDDQILIFDSITECAKHFGINPATITRCFRLQKPNEQGWSFIRLDKEDTHVEK